MPETETVHPTLEQAFADAKKTVNEGNDSAKTETDETETAKPPEPEKSEEAAGQATETADEVEPLLTKEEEKLTGKAREKAINRAWTKKNQAFSAQRKEMEANLAFIEQFKANPKEVVSRVAKELGMTVAEAKQQTEAKVDELTDDLQKALGPDLSFLAEKLSPVLKKLVDKTSNLEMTLEQQQLRMAQEQSQIAMDAFSEKHPDWKTFETKMVEIGRKLQPQGMDETEYMEILYGLATKDQADVKATKAAVKRIEKAVSGAETSESGVGATNVAPAPPSKTPTLQEAFEAAKKGIRWES